MLSGKKILVTGATGQVARPVAEVLATGNEVWCLGRFGDPRVENELIERGMRTWRWHLGGDGLDGLPDDFTHVLHSAVARGDGIDFDSTVEVNSVAAGQLMTHCRHAEAFLFVSSGALYARLAQDHRYTESDPLGGQAPWLPTYPVGKMSTEGAVRAYARTLGLPTVIARLNVAYGPHGHGGVPALFFGRMRAGLPIEVPRSGQNWCSPIHTDDIARQVPLLWSVASVPATVVNWGGDEMVGIEEMMGHVAEMTGVPVIFSPSDVTRETCAYDNTRREVLVGRCEVGWRDGVRRTIEEHFPGAVTEPGEGFSARPGQAELVSRLARPGDDPIADPVADPEGGNADQVRAAYEAFRRRDVDGVLARFAPGIEWTHPDAMDRYGLGGTKKGYDEVRAFIARVPGVFAEMRPEPGEIVSAGARVVVFGTHHMTARSGRTCTVRFVHSWTFEGGLAVRFEDYFDSATVIGMLEGTAGSAVVPDGKPESVGVTAAATSNHG